jgi:UDP-2,3-diacylglucosamine hydrolase
LLIYFIADLHLSEDRPDITACFLSFLQDEAPKAQTLYILGDLFEYWVGDDDDSPFVVKIAQAIKSLSLTGTQVYFIHGNRDFLLGKKYAQKAGMMLLPESYIIDLFGQKALIMHGDTLCTHDVEYQQFRKKSRSWWWQFIIKSLPLSVRKKIAANYRNKSALAKQNKSMEIMDVTQEEVIAQLRKAGVNLLIHGHTHRPAIHQIQLNNQNAQRIVLGDWYHQGAWLKVTPTKMQLLNTPFE